ncbi:hypothetical protein SK128_020224, partial [Halocaridina rubra]
GRHKHYTCPHCFKSYSSKSNLNTHVRDLHAAVPQIFTCPYCQKKYSTKNSLRYHIAMYHRVEKNRDQALQLAIATAQPLQPSSAVSAVGSYDSSARDPTMSHPNHFQQQQQPQQLESCAWVTLDSRNNSQYYTSGSGSPPSSSS